MASATPTGPVEGTHSRALWERTPFGTPKTGLISNQHPETLLPPKSWLYPRSIYQFVSIPHTEKHLVATRQGAQNVQVRRTHSPSSAPTSHQAGRPANSWTLVSLLLCRSYAQREWHIMTHAQPPLTPLRAVDKIKIWGCYFLLARRTTWPKATARGRGNCIKFGGASAPPSTPLSTALPLS